MEDNKVLEFTQEGFNDFVNALTDYPEEERFGIAVGVIMGI